MLQVKSNKRNLSRHAIGCTFALLAAMINSSIGILNRFGFEAGATFSEIAFYKTLGAFLLLSMIIASSPTTLRRTIAMRSSLGKISILALTGVFTLYYFETLAFQTSEVPLVAFLLYASGIVSILLGVVYLKESASVSKIASGALILVGSYFLVAGTSTEFSDGAIYAIVGGTGYALFIFFSRVFQIPAGVPLLWWMFGLGTIFLFVPFAFTQTPTLTLAAVPYIASLAVFPTICGFYLTVKATQYTEAGKVQIIETSDPVFASLFAYLILGDNLTSLSWLGCGGILLGLLVLNSTNDDEST